jgi:hypothetical protein
VDLIECQLFMITIARGDEITYEMYICMSTLKILSNIIIAIKYPPISQRHRLKIDKLNINQPKFAVNCKFIFFALSSLTESPVKNNDKIFKKYLLPNNYMHNYQNCEYFCRKQRKIQLSHIFLTQIFLLK